MNFRNNRYVVVDLEATSTGSKAKIIQVGIVVIEDGEIVEQYATDVNPCLLYTSPSPRDPKTSRMPSSA